MWYNQIALNYMSINNQNKHKTYTFTSIWVFADPGDCF